MEDLLIIGGGMAGLTAAMYAARYGFEPLVIEKLYAGGQLATIHEIENYSGFEEPVSGLDLSEKTLKQAERSGAKITYGEILSVDLTGEIKKIATRKQEYQAKAVIVTAGAKPRLLGLPNEEKLTGAGVSYCATCDGAFFRGKDVTVVGGGDTAFTDALFLSKFCSKVTLVHRRGEFRANADLVEKVRSRENVVFVLDSVAQEIQETDGRVSGLVVKNKNDNSLTQIPCEGIFAAVGYIPLTELFKGQLELDESGYIVAGETMETNLPGVFAAGDIRTKPLRQVITAAADGAVAAFSCAQYLSR